MITFNTLGIHGQLGNQMFQYALLQGISSKTGEEVVFTESIKAKSYLFDIFNLTRYRIDPLEIPQEYREPKFEFNEEVFTKKDTSFFGYFQSEKYFEHCSDIIKKEFTFNSETENKANGILKPFKGKTLVSVHVRRGDYLINPDFHPLPSIEYYKKGFELLDDGNTVFVCVSNDINWCKENFTNSNIIFQFNSLDVDMCLISKCDHHIIANSSFSWWGSWLSNNPNRKIIAPTPWFGPRASEYNTKDLYRDEFIVL
jgi:hypothetical protein